MTIAVQTTRRIPTNQLKLYGKNPRQGNIAAVIESLRAHGQFRALVVREQTMEVLAGNHTLLALRELGETHALCHLIDCTADQAKRIVLADNRTSDLATYDDQALADLLSSLDGDLDGTAFDEQALDELLASVAPDRSGDDTEPGEVPAEPVSKPGDLWVLGEHRLLCGDATVEADTARLMAGEQAAMMLTDPPYGIGLDTDYRSLTGSARALGRKGMKPVKGTNYPPVIGDERPFDAALVSAQFTEVKEQFWFGADYYRRTLSADDRDGSWLVWDKRKDTQSEAFGSEFELIWSRQPHKRRTLRHDWFGFLSSANAVDARSRSHPTQKPVTLFEDILGQWSKSGVVVVDPFAGSGTTLIACENLNRRCYAVEIDPGYCDVIINRWERHTGNTATHG